MPRGGKRISAGRPVGSGRFGEPTKAIRVPLSQIEHIAKIIQNRCYKLPLFQSAVAAGFPSPAESEMDQLLDLNELLIKHPVATFFVRVSGSSMTGAGINHNDILIVDRSVPATSGKIVIAAVNGELTVKRLHKEGEQLSLLAENSAYPPIKITRETELHIWGVVTNVIHAV
jgi:DNA polymerase V